MDTMLCPVLRLLPLSAYCIICSITLALYTLASARSQLGCILASYASYWKWLKHSPPNTRSHDFYLLRYDTTVLRAAGNLTAAGELAPWDRRNPAAYGRYDLRVARSRHARDRTTYRYGTGDMRICSGTGETRCFVRRHLWGITEVCSGVCREGYFR